MICRLFGDINWISGVIYLSLYDPYNNPHISANSAPFVKFILIPDNANIV